MNLETLEQRYNALTLQSNMNERQKTLSKLQDEAKRQFKELNVLVGKSKNIEKKLNDTLYNIENIDEYLANKKGKKAPKSETSNEEELDA